MWIGVPDRFRDEGGLREITDGAKSFDRSPGLGAVEFRSLAGGVTVWAAPTSPRRYKLAWEAMQPDDVRHIDLLARRSYSVEPVAVLDPLSSNMLGHRQAEGRGSVDQWGYTASEVSFLASDVEPFKRTADVKSPATGGTIEISWLNPAWSYYPIPANKKVTWWPRTLALYASGIDGIYLHWYTRGKTLVSSSSQSDVTRPLVGTAPNNAAFVRPAVRFKTAGLYPMGVAVLALGDTSAALLAGAYPVGEGSPAYSITGYRHAATAGDGRWRDIGLDLVEVINAAG